MTPALMIAVFAAAFVVAALATLCSRNRRGFFLNFLAAGAGAFALVEASRQMGIGYAEFGVDLATSLVFSVAGALVAILFIMMGRDLCTSKPAETPHRSSEPGSFRSGAKLRRPSVAPEPPASTEFQTFLAGEPVQIARKGRRARAKSYREWLAGHSPG